ncbi:MAG: hypothetical protein HY017_02360 [Betaproteobacteria bacterium]|nr:hypothetical protein [Betaproteobacteria bacterium]
MRERLIALRERRAGLIVCAEIERGELAGWIARTDAVSRWAGTGVGMFRELKRHPLWIAGAVALVFVLRPGRTLQFAARWAAAAWSLWRLVRRLRRARAWWQRFAAPTVEIQ